MEEIASVYEEGEVSYRDYIEVTNFLLEAIRLANKMWGTMDEGICSNITQPTPSVITYFRDL